MGASIKGRIMKLWIYKGSFGEVINRNDLPYYLEQGYKESPKLELPALNQQPDLDKLTVKELKELLDNKEVTYKSKDTKAKLIEMFKNAN